MIARRTAWVMLVAALMPCSAALGQERLPMPPAATMTEAQKKAVVDYLAMVMNAARVGVQPNVKPPLERFPR